MSNYAENKPLIEYGDLNSEHHASRHEREKEEARIAAMMEEPPKLVVNDGPGNLYVIAWSYGDMEVPFECHGNWNHKGRATDAIKAALARLRKEAAADVLAQAQADEAAALAADVEAEKERLEKETAMAELPDKVSKATEEKNTKPPRKPRGKAAAQTASSEK